MRTLFKRIVVALMLLAISFSFSGSALGLTSKNTPPAWLLESIGGVIQDSMPDQDVTFWTSDSGVYITIGMPADKSDLKLWALTAGHGQFYDFCEVMNELSESAWGVIVNQGYDSSAILSIEVVATPSGGLLLSYFNGNQSYNFLEE